MPCTEPGDKAFNTSFYTLACDLSAWDKETAGEVTIFTRTGSSAISLRDKAGALTTVTVPDGGSLVVSPDCIIVSHAVMEAPGSTLDEAQKR